MSTFVTFVSSPSAAKAVDEKTLSIKTACGTLITFNFFDTAAIKAVADEIYSGLSSPAAASWNNNISGSDVITKKVDTLVIDNNTPSKKDTPSKKEIPSSESSVDQRSAGSGSETEYEATPRKEDPDSSYESYDGHGLTQEAFF